MYLKGRRHTQLLKPEFQFTGLWVDICNVFSHHIFHVALSFSQHLSTWNFITQSFQPLVFLLFSIITSYKGVDQLNLRSPCFQNAFLSTSFFLIIRIKHTAKYDKHILSLLIQWYWDPKWHRDYVEIIFCFWVNFTFKAEEYKFLVMENKNLQWIVREDHLQIFSTRTVCCIQAEMLPHFVGQYAYSL